MTTNDFVFSYHMRAPSEAQQAVGTRIFNVWVWKTNELDEQGDPRVSPCFSINMLLPCDVLAQYTILDLHQFVGERLAEKLTDALAGGPGNPLHDRIMKVRAPLQ